MDPKRVGDTTIKELQEAKSYSFSTGAATVKRFFGTLPDLEAKASEFVGPGVAWTIRPNDGGGTGTLEVTLSMWLDGSQGSNANTPLLTLWFCQGEDLEKDILDIDAANALSSQIVQDGTNKTTERAALLSLRSDPNYSLTWKPNQHSALANEFFQYVVLGDNVYFLSRPVLRRVDIVAGNYTEQEDLTTVGMVYTTAQLKTAEQIPATVLFSMPNGEWLKRTPDFEQLQNGKFQITNHWIFAPKWNPRYPHVP